MSTKGKGGGMRRKRKRGGEERGAKRKRASCNKLKNTEICMYIIHTYVVKCMYVVCTPGTAGLPMQLTFDAPL